MTFPPLQKYSEAYHYIATSMPKTEETKQHHQMLERVWNNQDSHTLCWWEQINGTTSLKVVWQLIKKLNTHLPFDPAIPTQENWKHMSTNKLLQKCPIKFIHNNQNLEANTNACFLVNGKNKCDRYIHTIKYYWAIKMN